MARLPKDLEEKRLRLLGAVRRGAFESYMRRGCVPDVYDRIAEVARDAKALNTDIALDTLTPVKPAGRPTTHYVWRTAGDNRVRGEHAARNGQIFAWNDPPEHGHPGREANCRCWPEPYYGNPAVPDAMLAMVAERRLNADPGVLWASIDTLTRPDGSLAASNVVLNDGTVIDSTFVGSSVEQTVKRDTERDVLVSQRDRVQAIHVGDEASPIVESAWRSGPVVKRTRVRSAFQEPLDPLAPRHLIYSEPGGAGDPSTSTAGGVLAAALALIDLYNQRNADPASQGGVEGDPSFVAFRAWATDGKPNGERLPVPIMVGSLTDEQVRETCKRLPEVQQWTDAAAKELAYLKPLVSPARWGTAVHTVIKRTIDALKLAMPAAYADIQAELSFNRQGTADVYYSQDDSIRLDVVEDRVAESGAVCFYDMKTGKRGLTPKRLQEIAEFVAANYGSVVFYIIEIRPNQ
jgi:SPP1 gp7 family putative phage head morphogenesis protein